MRSLQDDALGGEALLTKLNALRAENAALSHKVAAEMDLRRAAVAETGASTSKTGNSSNLDRAPSPVTQIRPIYPPSLRNSGVGGQVLVDFVVDSQGNVQNAYAASSSQKEFEQPAVDAISQWQFSPGRKADIPVDTHMQIPVVFSVDNSPTSPSSTSPTDWFASSPAVVGDAFTSAAH